MEMTPLKQLTLTELQEALTLLDDERNESVCGANWESVTNWLTGGSGYVQPHHQFASTEEFMNWLRY
jgi:hypothetical protein